MGGRYRTEGLRKEPAGVCDACNRYAWDLHQADIKCWFCDTGWFRPRWNWHFLHCPCGWNPLCKTCGGRGYAPVPIEQLDDGKWVSFIELDDGLIVVDLPGGRQYSGKQI